MNNEFAKSDLKTGMIVRLRNKYGYLIVINDKLKDTTGFMDIESYKDDLTCKNEFDNLDSSDYDIVEVYETDNKNEDTIKNINKDLSQDIYKKIVYSYPKKSIWKRVDNLKEMTIEQIEKELGYKIKIIETII